MNPRRPVHPQHSPLNSLNNKPLHRSQRLLDLPLLLVAR